MLWNLTNFYGNVDQFAMLSRGISNDIISACGRLSDVSDAILTTQRTVAEHLKVRSLSNLQDCDGVSATIK